MRIGVISDTHGMVDRTTQAVAVFDGQGIDTIIHCGDVGGLEVFERFVGKHLRFVWGNTDRPEQSWRGALEMWGFPWPARSPLAVELAGRQILIAHGHEAGFRQALHRMEADYLFCGHSHTRQRVRIGKGLVINPGAIHRTPLPTVATVDLIAGDARFFDLQGREVGEE